MNESRAATRLDDWLDWQLDQPGTRIELGLDRVAVVADRLDLLPPVFKTIVVAGTNGKGSCVALIEALTAKRQRVGVFTSPHLWHYTERFRIAGKHISEAAICAAFEAIETARGDVRLTYFEYSALAALWLFKTYEVELAVLEVGLGGRLDAVNVVDADVALITNIGLDHRDWLGDDREQIGAEKAGIMRAERPAIVADRTAPNSVIGHARAIGAALACIGHDFDIDARDDQHRIRIGKRRWTCPAEARVIPDNLASAVAAVDALGYTPSSADVTAASCGQSLAGRCEFVDSRPTMVYDVAHNIEAVEVLVSRLKACPVAGCTHVVLAMLADKPVESVIERLNPIADYWYPAGLERLATRGLGGDALAVRGGLDAATHTQPSTALAAALEKAEPADRIVVCGSFYTVADARGRQIQARRQGDPRA